MQLRYIGYQKIESPSSSTALTLPSGQCNFIRVEVEGEDVRWRGDAVAPTSTEGGLLSAGGQYEYQGNLNLVRLIEVAAGADINITYYQTTGTPT